MKWKWNGKNAEKQEVAFSPAIGMVIIVSPSLPEPIMLATNINLRQQVFISI